MALEHKQDSTSNAVVSDGYYFDPCALSCILITFDRSGATTCISGWLCAKQNDCGYVSVSGLG